MSTGGDAPSYQSFIAIVALLALLAMSFGVSVDENMRRLLGIKEFRDRYIILAGLLALTAALLLWL